MPDLNTSSPELDTWSIVERPFEVAWNRHYEGLFALGSGALQQRASLEEGLTDDPQDREYLRVMGNVTVEEFPRFKSRVGTYLPGVSGPHPTCRDEMVNLPAVHGLLLYIAGERLDMESPRVSEYSRRLELRTARLIREFTWRTSAGARLRFRFERFISAARRHVMALRCAVEHLEGPPAEIRFLAPLDADVRTNGFDHLSNVEITGEHEPITLAVRTNSDIVVGAAALVACSRPTALSVEVQPRWVALCGTLVADAGRTVTLDKFAALTSSRHTHGPPVDVARRLAWDAATAGFARLGVEHDAVWRERWDQTDVVIEGDPPSQRALRVSLYHLLRAVVEDDPRCAIDAKAAAGEAYCGRYFWDTEMFMLPLFLYTRPEVGRTLARFRIASLDGARRNARRYGYPGARYAWESAPSGDENCPNWQYADHEVHVTADVAYGLFHAHLCNPADAQFFRDCVEVFVETARYWRERVTYNAERDDYEMLLVMGPDEYTPFSRNNAYTNRLAAFALALAVFAWRQLEHQDASSAAELRARLGLHDEELARFAEIASKLRFPYDAARKLVLQSDDFFTYEPLDFARWWPDRTQRLAAVVSQERLYRSQALKQGDVVQLMALFPQDFDDEQVRVAYETYEPLTSHDSSLSKSMHALVALRLGRDEDAWRFWQESVGLDLQLGAAAEGIHAACAGANWQVAILGFAGLRTCMQTSRSTRLRTPQESAGTVSGELLTLDPHLPVAWTALRFPLVWAGQPLHVTIKRAADGAHVVEIEHRGDRPIEARVAGQSRTLRPGPGATPPAPAAPR